VVGIGRREETGAGRDERETPGPRALRELLETNHVVSTVARQSVAGVHDEP